MVLFILVLLNNLILLFLMYGVSKLIILIFVLRILIFVDSWLNEGVCLWIGFFFVFVGIGLFKLIFFLSMLNIWLSVILLIGIEIGVFVFIVFILCWILFVDVIVIVWIVLLFKWRVILSVKLIFILFLFVVGCEILIVL